MMIQRILLFRNLVENIPKNIGLYSVGILLLVLYRIAIETTSILLGMLAFIISYSSVYVLNDIWDIAEDVKDAEKIPRKPLARGYVDRREAVKLSATLLVIGLVFSTCLNILFFGLMCSLIVVNILYSAPLIHNSRIGHSSHETAQKHNSYGVEYRTSLKYTVVGLPLIFIMQFLKILLPWTISSELANFPYFFGLGFSCMYLVFFKGYKENETVGECIKQAPILALLTVVIFVLSFVVHPEPVLQAMILMYLLAGITFFWKSRFTDRKVIVLGSIYIIVGVFALLYLMTYIGAFVGMTP
ncbi:MAG: UbiA family prenyltransferase [Candidatus Thorarchaeota archaeon]|jgi:hypothetical protein